MKAYKVFGENWKCRGFQFEVGKTYYHEGPVRICESGFHACVNPADCFNYYSFDSKNKVAEVELSDLIQQDEGDKVAASKITIVREIPWHEVLELVNTGDRNTGNRNTGDRNTGDLNTGDRNTGNWNTGNLNTGYLNTVNGPIYLFNKITKKTLSNINFPNWMYFENVVFIDYSNATDQERIKYQKGIEVTGGFLRVIPYKEAAKLSFDKANEKDQRLTKELPNFDMDIFEKIFGFRF